MFRKILLLIQFSVILGTLLAYLSPMTPPSSTWLCYFFGIGLPYLNFLNLFFVIFWFRKKKRFWIYSAAVLLFGIGSFTKYWGISLWSGSSKNKNISVLTLNTNSFDYLYKNPKRSQIISDFLQDNNPDIVCFQEHCTITACAEEQINKIPYFNNMYFAHIAPKSLLIYSKYPVINSGILNFNTNNNDVLFADLNVNQTIIRVYCVHIRSNHVSSRANGLLNDKEFDKDARQTFVQVFRAVKNNYQIREKQANRLHEHIASSPYPVIVAGDLNDTPHTYTYKTISQNLQDTWQCKGFGRGSTYAGKIPFLRIDYIFTDESFDVLNSKVIRRDDLSDHYPVLSKVALKE